MTKLKIAASTYLNSAPLVYSFLNGSLKNTCEFLGDAAPARCADLLKQRLVDVALIPVIEYQFIKDICLIPDIAVAAKDSVQSVLLISKCPINQLNRVALDTSSRTSATLVQIILERFYQIKPTYFNHSPNLNEMLKMADAALIIGDPAIKIKAENYLYYIYDLAQEWRAFTSLPFVFACWAVNKNILQKSDKVNELHRFDIKTLFAQAKGEGLSLLDQIAKDYSKELEIEDKLLLDYLTKNVNYDLDSENIAGLEHFYRLAFESGLIQENRLVEFIK